MNAELAAVRFSHDTYDRQIAEVLRSLEQVSYDDGTNAEKLLTSLKARRAAELGIPRPIFIPLVRRGSGFFAVSDIALATWILDDPITFERAGPLDPFAAVFTLQNVFTTRDSKLREELRQFFKSRTNGLSDDQLAAVIEILRSRTDRMLSAISSSEEIQFIPKIEGMVLEAYAEAFLGMKRFPRSEECSAIIKKIWQLKSLRNNITIARFNPINLLLMLLLRRRLFRIIDAAQDLLDQSGSIAAKDIAEVYAAHGHKPGNLMNALIPLYETISRAVTFALMELARAPSVQEDLRCEIGANAREELGYCASTSTLLHRVWQETLRLWPPISNQTRRVTTENNPLFAKGSKVVVVWSVFHRDEEVWGDDVNVFNPKRWLSLTRDQRHNFRPFGSGAQHCVAMDYASIGGRTILKRIVESRLLKPPEGPMNPIITDRAYSRGADPHLSLLRFAPTKQEENTQKA